MGDAATCASGGPPCLLPGVHLVLRVMDVVYPSPEKLLGVGDGSSWFGPSAAYSSASIKTSFLGWMAPYFYMALLISSVSLFLLPDAGHL